MSFAVIVNDEKEILVIRVEPLELHLASDDVAGLVRLVKRFGNPIKNRYEIDFCKIYTRYFEYSKVHGDYYMLSAGLSALFDVIFDIRMSYDSMLPFKRREFAKLLGNRSPLKLYLDIINSADVKRWEDLLKLVEIGYYIVYDMGTFICDKVRVFPGSIPLNDLDKLLEVLRKRVKEFDEMLSYARVRCDPSIIEGFLTLPTFIRHPDEALKMAKKPALKGFVVSYIKGVSIAPMMRLCVCLNDVLNMKESREATIRFVISMSGEKKIFESILKYLSRVAYLTKEEPFATHYYISSAVAAGLLSLFVLERFIVAQSLDIEPVAEYVETVMRRLPTHLVADAFLVLKHFVLMGMWRNYNLLKAFFDELLPSLSDWLKHCIEIYGATKRAIKKLETLLLSMIAIA